MEFVPVKWSCEATKDADDISEARHVVAVLVRSYNSMDNAVVWDMLVVSHSYSVL